MGIGEDKGKDILMKVLNENDGEAKKPSSIFSELMQEDPRDSMKEVVEETPETDNLNEELLGVEEEEIPSETETSFEIWARKFKATDEYIAIEKYLEAQRKLGEDVPELDYFLECKYEHNNLKLVIAASSFDSLSLGGENKYFLIKPLYRKEYNEFLKHFKRDVHQEEFIDHCISNCTLYPTNLPKNISAGVSNVLYSSIIKLSDLNTIYKVVEL